MNNTTKKLIAGGTIITSILIGGTFTTDTCRGQRVVYNDKEICMTLVDYSAYSKEIMKEYRKGTIMLSDLDEFYNVLTIEIQNYAKENGKFKIKGLNKDNLIDLTIKELGI